MRRSIPIATLWIAFLAPPGLAPQHTAPPPPAAWAIEGATVVSGDGRVQEGMTVVIRDGLVETLREGAPVPADARRIEGNGGPLHVHPGFIDGDGYAAVTVPAPDREGIQAWSPTREVQEFTPGRIAAHYLTADGRDLTSYRRKGVVASVAHPGRGPVPGQVSAILHRPDARTPQELVLVPSLGVAMSFQGARGVYPGTLFGVHALIRQGFFDAEHHAARRNAYASDARGVELATWDEDLRILEEVRTGIRTVFFRANDAEDIRRVLRLSEEIGFRPVIVGGHEAGAVAGELAARNVPVLFGLNLPRPDAWSPDSGDEEESPAAYRERVRLEGIYRTPAVLHEAGVPFAFTSGGSADSDLLAGLRRTVEYGLPPEAVVRALTLAPAEILGLPRMGRIEEGLAANLVITDGPLTADGTRVGWTFVNGHAERGADLGSPTTADSDQEPADVAGTWTLELQAEGMTLPITLTIDQEGTGFTGSMDSQMGTARIMNGTVQGNAISFLIEMPGMDEPLSASATIEGDRMRGTASGPPEAGAITFSGSRGPGAAGMGGGR